MTWRPLIASGPQVLMERRSGFSPDSFIDWLSFSSARQRFVSALKG
jgi:hypothetical protein